jgi:hypothetical protein
MAAIDMLRLGAEAYLAELPDDEFADLVKAVRPPKSCRYPAKRNSKRRNGTKVSNG